MIYQKAKLKSTGEIVTVYKCAGCHNTEYYQDANNERKKYVVSQLNFDFIPPLRGVLNPKHPASPFEPYDLMSCDPMQMVCDDVNHIAHIHQTIYIKMNQEVIKNALHMATSQQLKDELKRRADMQRAFKGDVMRCKNCKHCIQGYTTRRAASRGDKTSVCEMRPKEKEWRGCFYATRHSRKACEMFEKK